METIVSKFGGSATTNAGMLGRVGSILSADPARRCAVLSAPGGALKVTDLLAECASLRDAGRPMDGTLGKVVERFGGIARGLGLPDERDAMREELESAALRSTEMLLSRGEALCARLFARWMGWPYLDAAAVIRFDASGALDVPRSLALLREAARGLDRFVLPGFYGADERGVVHTLPRNGSDITGALAAAALGADVYENWVDVPGLMSADPDIVPDARPIPRVSYGQMADIAAAGAKVLHPGCLAPVAAAGITTRLRPIMAPSSAGTLVDGSFAGVVRCVAGTALPDAPGQAVVTVFGASAAMKPKLAAGLSGGLTAEDETAHRFVTRVDRLADDLRAAHRILYP